MTDCEFILDVLGDGEEHSLAELLTRSMAERGCGLTVHSRVAQLRTRGHVIEHATVKGAERGHGHTYRLVSLAEPVSSTDQLATGSPALGYGGNESGSASEGDLTLFADARPLAYRDAA